MREEVKLCVGSGLLPVARMAQVGVCSGCAVRTFLDDQGLIQSHVASRAEVREFTRMGMRQMKGRL